MKILGFVKENDLVIGPGPTLALADFLQRIESGEVLVDLERATGSARDMPAAVARVGDTDI